MTLVEQYAEAELKDCIWFSVFKKILLAFICSLGNQLCVINYMTAPGSQFLS